MYEHTLVALSVKNPLAMQAGGLGLIPGSGGSPGEGNVNLLQYSRLGNLMDRGDGQASVHRIAESDLSQITHLQKQLVLYKSHNFSVHLAD